MNYTKYDTEVIEGCEVENVRLAVNPDFSDFPKNKFPIVYRSSFGKEGQRLYAMKGSMEFFCGITSAIGRSGLVDQSFLNKARVKMAFEGKDADAIWQERANYGSCLHLLVAMHERGELVFEFHSDEWRKVADSFIEEYGYQALRSKWYSDLMNDMYSWFDFKKEKNVRVITTEVAVYHPEWMIITPLDVIAEMDFNKGRVIANINLKTGDTHAFSDSYYLQTSMEAYLYNQIIGDSPYKLSASFCWRPKTREKTPGAWELSKNTISSYTPKHFARVGETVLLAEPPMNQASGAIVSFFGNESNFHKQLLTPYEWLARINGVDGNTW